MGYVAQRRLQVFRNGIVLTASRDEAKHIIHNLLEEGELLLRDGEPIFVRYIQKGDEAPGGLLGLRYDVDDEFGNHYTGIKWIDDGNVNILTEGDNYVNLTYTEDNGTYTISASANIARLDNVECDGCFIRIASLPEGAVYAKYEDTYYTLGESFPINCRGFEGKFYLYDSRQVDLDIDITVQVVNGQITYLPPVPGFEIQFFEGGDGLASACDVKSHIHYYEIDSENGTDNPITVIGTDTVDTDGFAVTEYTVGLKVSNEPNNNLAILDDGLYVATADAILDVRNLQVPCEGTDDGVLYYYVWLSDGAGERYVRVTRTQDNRWYIPSTQQYYTDSSKVSNGVECGHRYLTIRTTTGRIFMTLNDAGDDDTKVTNFAISQDGTNLVITQNDNSTFSVSLADITNALRAAVVNWNSSTDDLTATTSGILTNNAINVIEDYIDNYDCGTF